MTEQVFHQSNAMHCNAYIEHPYAPDHDMEWTHHSPLKQFRFEHCLQNHKTCIEISQPKAGMERQLTVGTSTPPCLCCLSWLIGYLSFSNTIRQFIIEPVSMSYSPTA